jgi:hypothetical protein
MIPCIESRTERGMALLLLLLGMLPLAMAFAGFAGAMRGRDSRLSDELVRERCFWAAEAGIDEAIARAGAGLLTADTTFRVDLGQGLYAMVTPTHLGGDGVDNDADSQVDETDEDIVEVRSAGSYAGCRRELVSWLGRTSFLPPLNAAATVASPGTDIRLSGTPRLDGNNYNLDGTPGDPALSQNGLSIMQPGSIGDLQGHLSSGESSLVLGTSGPPSLGTTPAFDVAALAAMARNWANLVLTNNSYSSFDFGNASAGTGVVAYRDGDVRFAGNSQGAGLLVVTGDLVVTGNFRFDGVVVVLGSLRAGAGTVDINGAMVLGPDAAELRATGTFRLHYCDDAIRLANRVAGRYVAFNGWQELAR